MRGAPSQSAGEPGDAYLAPTAGATRRVVLCVEDDLECSLLIKEEFEERGFEVVVANSGREGLSLLQSLHVDLVLSDVNMPEMSGFELLDKLNEISANLAKIPFIFLTALTDDGNEMRGRKLGADDYVRKPIDFDVLHAIIKARLGRTARRHVPNAAGEH